MLAAHCQMAHWVHAKNDSSFSCQGFLLEYISKL